MATYDPISLRRPITEMPTLNDATNLSQDKEAPAAPALFIAPPTQEKCVDLTADDMASGNPLLHGIVDEALYKAPSQMDPAAEESCQHIDFVLNHADKRYRLPLEELYLFWQDCNESYFEGRLQVPHLTIAAGPPQALGFFKKLTDYGGRTQITIDARILAARRKFVKRPWPFEGNRLFVIDVLRHEMVHQYLDEIEHFEERENAKHGEAFADVCNRIGRTMGLARVFTRRRCAKDRGKPLANSWPINVRPEGYYLGHVIPPREPRPQRLAELRGMAGPLSFLRYLLDSGQTDKLAAIVHREAGLSQEQACIAKPAVEKGQVNHLNPGWLTWNDGCVSKMLHAICHRKMYDLMPLLADTLEAAGCGDELLLDHCRLAVRHTRKCWVLEALVNA